MEQHPEVAQSFRTISCTVQLLFISNQMVCAFLSSTYHCYGNTPNQGTKKKTDMTMNTCISILNSSNMYGFGLMDQVTVNLMSM